MRAQSIHAKTAKCIRADLKKKFERVKFSVESQCYSMGNSVNVSWVGGPLQAEVEAIIKKYQYGHFDGMIDCYINSAERHDIPQVKFVFAKRYSEGA